MSLPIWRGKEEFIAGLDQMVREPFERPETFHPELTPIRHLVGVYGRSGMKSAVKAYCDSITLPCATIDVEFGATSVATECIDRYVQKNAQEQRTNRIRFALIIDHADVLAFEPDNEASMMYSLRMGAVAKQNDFLFICLFSRVPTAENTPNLAATTRMFRKVFFDQFGDTRIYLAPPNAAFRVEYFKAAFSTYCELNKITLNLDDGNYKLLADASSYCTPQNMLCFLQRVFYDRPKEKIDWELLCKYTVGVGEERLIMRGDPRVPENEFSIFCGNEPIVGLKVVNPNAPTLPPMTRFDPVDQLMREEEKKQNKKKRARVEKEDEEGEGGGADAMEEEDEEAIENVWRKVDDNNNADEEHPPVEVNG